MRLPRIIKRKLLRISFLIFSGLMIFSLLLLRIWMLSDAIKLAYEVDNLIVEKEKIEEENTKLVAEIARLKSTDRIKKIAMEDLNMVMASKTKVILIER